MNTDFNKKIRDTIKKYGTGYYRATFFFPRKIREATWTYYQFVRIVDEFVDGQGVKNRKNELSKWENEWNQTQTRKSKLELFNQYKNIIKTYNIPLEYTEEFFDCMKQDLVVSRYKTYSDLEKYMHGSAVVIGYTMSYIIGFKDGALPHAKALGEAFQMTNFLRDIREDYEERGRIYIPEEDMNRFSVTAQDIADHKVSDEWCRLMKFEVERNKELYKVGLAGIPLLQKRGRRAVYAAMLIYKEILDKIEENNYDIFSKRITVRPLRKTVLLLKALWKRNL